MARIIISLTDELLEELNEYTQRRSYNRSECIRHAIRNLIQEGVMYAVPQKNISEKANNVRSFNSERLGVSNS